MEVSTTFTKPKEDWYKYYLKALFSSSLKTRLSDFEIELLNLTKENKKFDSSLFSSKMGKSIPQINNYKKRLIEKSFLFKTFEGIYTINPKINIPLSMNDDNLVVKITFTQPKEEVLV